jgi:Bacterial Ig-like domain
MANAPTVTSVTPGVDETDVVLGTSIIVVFNQLMDHASISPATFSVTGPGQTQIITPTQLIAENPRAVTGREYINGAFEFDDTINSSTQTQVTFIPATPLQTNAKYTVLLIGSGAVLTSDAIVSAYGVQMVGSYQWSFITGMLNLVIPPPQAPVQGAAPQLNPNSIRVIPRQTTGTDLSQEIDLIFPDSVSLAPYDPTGDIIASVDAILGDPAIKIPAALTITPTWNSYGGRANRKLTLLISGWPVETPFDF